MRFMVIVKANSDSEAGIMPTREDLERMSRYNEELAKAGVMLAGEGLQPSSRGKRVRFTGKQTAVIDGPFAETKELIAGFWILKASSMDECLAWVKAAPFEGGAELEIRQIFEVEDFGDAMTPELRQQEERLREEVAARK